MVQNLCIWVYSGLFSPEMDAVINNPKVLVPVRFSLLVKFLANLLEPMELLANLVGLKGLGLNYQGHMFGH